MDAQYFVAQYIPDLFRNETRNVGVVVKTRHGFASHFVGESIESTQIDGRKLKAFNYPDVYRQWVEYWRDCVNRSSLDELLKSSSGHYQIIQGGEVSDTGEDEPSKIATYLYSLLVSEGGFAEAVSPMEPAVTVETSSLEDDVCRSLATLKLLANGQGTDLRHPVQKRVEIQGASLVHRPAFSQKNGRLHVMEIADLTVARKKSAIDHSGFAAYMFNDIKRQAASTECYTLARFNEEDLDLPDVNYAYKLLENESDVINWLDDVRRRDFVSELQRIGTTI